MLSYSVASSDIQMQNETYIINFLLQINITKAIQPDLKCIPKFKPSLKIWSGIKNLGKTK